MANRRQILVGSLGLGAASLTLPRLAHAAPAGGKKMLFLLLRGAADGLGVLAPMGDPDYERRRGTLAEDYADALKADGFFAFHPSLETVASLYGKGEVLPVHAVAGTYRERSHFNAQNMLESGSRVAYELPDGWMNRLIGVMGSEAPRALGIASAVPVALRGQHPASSYAPSALPDAREDLLARVTGLYADDPELAPVWQSALETREMAGDVGDARNLRNAQLAGQLAARLMAGPDGAGLAMLDLNGWDTHANQSGTLRRSLRSLDTLLAAFHEGMGAEWSDTLVMIATEFGRTVRTNGTNGTDHGTGGVAMLLGGGVKGGRVLADWPGLKDGDLFEGRDLMPTASTEALLAGAAAEHFGLDPELAMRSLFPGRNVAAMGGLLRV